MAIGAIRSVRSDICDRVPYRGPIASRDVAVGSEDQMFTMALMLFVIVVSYLLMLGLVKFAEGVIDKSPPAKLRDSAPSEATAKARSL